MFFMLTSRQKKRKRAFFYETLLEEEGDVEDIEGEYNEMINNVAAAVVGSVADKSPRKPRGPRQGSKREEDFMGRTIVTAKQFSGLARTSANISSSHSVHRLEFFGCLFFL